MKKIIRRCFVLMLVAVMLTGAMSVSTFAAAKKTVKKQTFDTKTKTIEKKATKVKRGTTNLTISKGEGYIKFVAPKTKTYSITFSNVKTKNGGSAFVEIQTRDADSPSYSFMTKVKTKGGKSNALWLSVNGTKFTERDVLERPLAKRTGKIKLKKGQPVYMYFYSGTKKTTAKLVIK